MNLSWDWLEKALELKVSNKPFAIATVTQIRGSTPREIGAKMIVVSTVEFYGTIGGGALEAEVLKEITKILNDGIKGTGARMLELKLADLSMVCGGTTHILVELVNTNPDLYIFGSGHCAIALSHALKGVPFNVHIIDERIEWLEKHASHVIKHPMHFKKFIDEAHFSQEGTFCVIMTPGHCDDRDVLELVIEKPTRFLGVMGSRSKWTSIKNQLIKNNVSSEKLEKVFCPIGLSLGGKSPAEIAISISAQLISKLYVNEN